jgi:hypothetical protein
MPKLLTRILAVFLIAGLTAPAPGSMSFASQSAVSASFPSRNALIVTSEALAGSSHWFYTSLIKRTFHSRAFQLIAAGTIVYSKKAELIMSRFLSYVFRFVMENNFAPLVRSILHGQMLQRFRENRLIKDYVESRLGRREDRWEFATSKSFEAAVDQMRRDQKLKQLQIRKLTQEAIRKYCQPYFAVNQVPTTQDTTTAISHALDGAGLPHLRIALYGGYGRGTQDGYSDLDILFASRAEVTLRDRVAVYRIMRDLRKRGYHFDPMPALRVMTNPEASKTMATILEFEPENKVIWIDPSSYSSGTKSTPRALIGTRINLLYAQRFS